MTLFIIVDIWEAMELETATQKVCWIAVFRKNGQMNGQMDRRTDRWTDDAMVLAARSLRFSYPFSCTYATTNLMMVAQHLRLDPYSFIFAICMSGTTIATG